MDENINTSAETQEVAEPETDVTESAETQEVAEPETAESPKETPQRDAKTEQDAAFAEMRRQNQALQRERDLMMAALGRYFDGETAEELSINANAYAEERDPDEYRQEYEQTQRLSALEQENAQLQDALLNAEAERLMREGLREVQAIDPNVKSLDDLGKDFLGFISAGMPTKNAYYAAKAMEMNEKILAPDAIGRVSETKVERDYYTSEELDNLSDEEMDANWDKVMRSLGRLK